MSLIWGAADREVPVSVAKAAADMIGSQGREVDFEILEGVGHFVPVEAPEALAGRNRAGSRPMTWALSLLPVSRPLSRRLSAGCGSPNASTTWLPP